jgi:hypothetical protein
MPCSALLILDYFFFTFLKPGCDNKLEIIKR